MKGVFVSDLHLFSRRSIGHKHWDDLQFSLSNSQLLVLGGDIFDFRWSRLGDHESTMRSAKDWLSSLLEKHKHLNVAYVLGNHDCSPAMQAALEDVEKSTNQFSWYEHIFRLGDKIFLHGDILDAGLTTGKLFEYRKKFSGEIESRGKLANILYDAMVASRIHRLPGQLHHTPKKTTSRLFEFLSQEAPLLANDPLSVYFGHTHAPINQKVIENIAFYNPGSGIKHLPFRPRFFEFTEEEVALSHELALDRLALPARIAHPGR